MNAMTSSDPWTSAYAPPAAPFPGFRGPSYGSAPPPPASGHSGFGVASFVVGIVTMVLEFAAFLAAGVLASVNGGDALPDDDPRMMLLGAFICLGLFLHVLGGVFGVVSLTATAKNRTLGVVGLVLNGLCALGVIALIVVGNLS